jgi:repressor LexA
MALTRRQKEILEYITSFIEAKGYSPSLEEIAENFGLSSLATVHKHIWNLVEKGYIRRDEHRSRSIDVLPIREGGAVHLPLLGRVAAGRPIEAVRTPETIAVPEEMVGRRAGEVYSLLVQGDSMIDEQIRDGDYVIVESRQTARDGEMVISLFDKDNSVTLKRLYREPGGRVRLQPANPSIPPIVVDAKDVRIQGVVIGVLRKY